MGEVFRNWLFGNNLAFRKQRERFQMRPDKMDNQKYRTLIEMDALPQETRLS